MARGPIRYLPSKPEVYQRHLRQLVEISGLSIEELALRIKKTPEWIRRALEDVGFLEESYKAALERCINENYPQYTADEIRRVIG